VPFVDFKDTIHYDTTVRTRRIDAAIPPDRPGLLSGATCCYLTRASAIPQSSITNMRPVTSNVAALPLLFASFVSALTPGCDHIRIGGKKFDLHKLGGPHSVLTHDESHPPAMHNTTWTVDICQPLRKEKKLPNADQCPSGTHVCGITTTYNPTLDPVVPEIDQVIPIAGNYEGSGGSGKSLDPHYERLKETDTSSDGLRMVLKGGSYAKKDQRAIIEFQCDEERSGNEGSDEEKRRRDEKGDKKENEDQQENTSSLTFVSYGELDDKTDVLRLNWRTKYACEDHTDRDDEDEGASRKGGWGFFTWFILMYALPASLPCRDANLSLALFLESQPTSSLALGSTITATVLAVGTCSLMAIPFETCPTCSKTGRKRWLTLWREVVSGAEADTALSSPRGDYDGGGGWQDLRVEYGYTLTRIAWLGSLYWGAQHGVGSQML
jgi:hypothetical protein